jgi:murein L,D-transpeptidase YcbB/YkuD
MSKVRRWIAAAALLPVAWAPASAQLQSGEAPTPEQVAAGETPAEVVPEEEKALRELQAQMAALRWTQPAARELLAFVYRVAEEGLEPADYLPDRLLDAIASNDEAILSTAATDTFLRVSSDLALGRVRGDGRLDWHTVDSDLDGHQQYELMRKAIAENSVRPTLLSLLPTHLQYAELKGALAATSDPVQRDMIRANLDRWRWLPRDLGKRYILVNVPAFRVAIVENGHTVSAFRAVVGKVETATPQLTATATGVIFNPWWEVPESIAPEVRGKKGYVTVKNGDKVRYRQPPGPSNALGRVKVVMPNNHAIYLHDTPSKAAFNKPVRAFSHGCIRTQNPLEMARLLLNDPKWDKAAIDRAVASGKTQRVNASAPIPVYITYFTAAALKDGAGITTWKDLYGRDSKVVTALNNRGEPVMAASAPAVKPPGVVTPTAVPAVKQPVPVVAKPAVAKQSASAVPSNPQPRKP